MKVYLSARYGRMAELVGYRTEMIAAGHESTAQWLDGGTFDATAENAKIDEDDVAASDVVVGFMEPPVEFSDRPFASRGGRHYEIGYARGLGIPCIMIGHEPENVFHEPREGMTVVASWAACLDEIGRRG